MAISIHEREMLESMLSRLDAVITMAESAGFNREIRIETADAMPHAAFRAHVSTVRRMVKLTRAALSKDTPDV